MIRQSGPRNQDQKIAAITTATGESPHRSHAPFESALIISIVAVFILLQREDLRDRLIRLFGSGDLHRTTVAMGRHRPSS